MPHGNRHRHGIVWSGHGHEHVPSLSSLPIPSAPSAPLPARPGSASQVPRYPPSHPSRCRRGCHKLLLVEPRRIATNHGRLEQARNLHRAAATEARTMPMSRATSDVMSPLLLRPYAPLASALLYCALLCFALLCLRCLLCLLDFAVLAPLRCLPTIHLRALSQLPRCLHNHDSARRPWPNCIIDPPPLPSPCPPCRP